MSKQELLHNKSHREVASHLATLEQQRLHVTDGDDLKDHIGNLPIEIFTEIVKLAVQELFTTPLVISQVSKQWRNVSHKIPFIWNVLVLTERRPKEKAQFWMERCKGRLKELSVRSSVMDACQTKAWTRHLEKVDWGHLEVLRVEKWLAVKFLSRIGKLEFLNRLQTLEIDRANSLDLFPPSIHNSKRSTLRHLTILNMPPSRLQNMPFQVRNLTSLTLRCTRLPREDLFVLLELNPLLEHLSLNCVIYGNSTSHVELSHLRSLRVDRYFPCPIYTLKMPALEYLHIENQSAETPFFYPLLNQYAIAATRTLLGHTRLTKIIIRVCETVTFDIDSEVPSAIISLLRVSPNLQHLEISRTTTIRIKPVIEALASTYYPPGGSTSKLHVTPLCPNLTHVDLSACPELETGSIVRMVKSRLPREINGPNYSLQGQKGQPTSFPLILSKEISFLNIDLCPQIDPGWLCWLQNHVPYVSCQL